MAREVHAHGHVHVIKHVHAAPGPACLIYPAPHILHHIHAYSFTAMTGATVVEEFWGRLADRGAGAGDGTVEGTDYCTTRPTRRREDASDLSGYTIRRTVTSLVHQRYLMKAQWCPDRRCKLLAGGD